jgi:hypothetical protein
MATSTGIQRQLAANDGSLYVNRWTTGLFDMRSPLYVPISSLGVQLISRHDSLWDGLNTEITHKATVQRRYGFLRHCSVQFSSSDYPLAFYSFKNTSGTIRPVVDTPTHVYTFTTSTLTSVFTKNTTAQTSFQKVGDTLYMCNGTDLKKWDGTTVSGWGIAAPVSAPTFTVAAGSLSAFSGYTYRFVYKNSSTGHISTASPPSLSTGQLTSQHVLVQGASSADPQVDKVDIYRTDDGGAIFYYLTTINNGGTWSYTDNTADSGLNDDIQAPLADTNDPPPSNGSLVRFHQGRMWVAANNFLYYGAGPDCTNGVPEEAFPPANFFKFAGKITGLASTTNGLIVFTQDNSYVVLGVDKTSFAPKPWQQNFGVASQNSLAQDGDVLFIFTSKSQLFELSDSLDEIGFPIQSRLAAYNPASVYLAIHRSGTDEGLFISNGSTEYYRYSVSMTCWSPPSQPVGGCMCLSSIEVGLADWRLMLGRGSVSGYLLKRDTATFSDDGQAFSANAVVGSLILAPPGRTARIDALILETTNTGIYPDLQVMLNEIDPNNGGGFVSLPNPVPDPPLLKPSTSVRMMRHYLKSAQQPLAQEIRHMQVKVSWDIEAAQSELLGMAIM